jgi:hypothetical protein
MRGALLFALTLAGCHLVLSHHPTDAELPLDASRDLPAVERRSEDRARELPAKQDTPRSDTAARDAWRQADTKPKADAKPKTDLKPKNDSEPNVDAKPKADAPKVDAKPKADLKPADSKLWAPDSSAVDPCLSWASWTAYGCIATYSCCFECTSAGGTHYKIYCDLADGCTCDDGKPLPIGGGSCQAAVQNGLCGP